MTQQTLKLEAYRSLIQLEEDYERDNGDESRYDLGKAKNHTFSISLAEYTNSIVQTFSYFEHTNSIDYFKYSHFGQNSFIYRFNQFLARFI